MAITAEEKLARDATKYGMKILYGIHGSVDQIELLKLHNRYMILRVLGDSALDEWLTSDEQATLEGRIILL